MPLQKNLRIIPPFNPYIPLLLSLALFHLEDPQVLLLLVVCLWCFFLPQFSAHRREDRSSWFSILVSLAYYYYYLPLSLFALLRCIYNWRDAPLFLCSIGLLRLMLLLLCSTTGRLKSRSVSN